MAGTVQVPPDTHVFSDASCFLKFGTESCPPQQKWRAETVCIEVNSQVVNLHSVNFQPLQM